MGERTRSATGNLCRTLFRQHGYDHRQAAVGAHAMSRCEVPEALGPKHQSRESDCGYLTLERDPYQDEGGEG